MGYQVPFYPINVASDIKALSVSFWRLADPLYYSAHNRILLFLSWCNDPDWMAATGVLWHKLKEFALFAQPFQGYAVPFSRCDHMPNELAGIALGSVYQNDIALLHQRRH